MFGALLLATALRPSIHVLSIKEIPPAEGETVASVEAGRISSTGYVILNVSKTPDGLVQPEVWSQSTGSVVVPNPNQTDPAYGLLGINSQGVAVGLSGYATAPEKLFVWPATSVQLPDLGQYSSGIDINESGVIVGTYTADQGAPHRAIKIQGGSFTALPPLKGYVQSAARAVNKNGEVAGVCDGGGHGPLATVWNSAGTPIMVPLLPNTFSSVVGGLNDKGEIVGVCSPGAKAFIYGSGGTVQISAAVGTCDPKGINNLSQVVGTLYYSPVKTAAFLYQNGATQDLNELLQPGSGWLLTSATGINDNGQVVGDGIYQGKPRAFILQLG